MLFIIILEIFNFNGGQNSIFILLSKCKFYGFSTRKIFQIFGKNYKYDYWKKKVSDFYLNAIEERETINLYGKMIYSGFYHGKIPIIEQKFGYKDLY